ncbi:MAG: class I SAM-dependent methyltransferase [Proteobacteria bacterium]|nr:class I SAM-dependent methyltransferase [Pseudomonadota bacterium]
MKIDKFHYYDGKPYEIIFDRAMKGMRHCFIDKIEAGTKVIDIGCGIGSLVFDLAEKCSFVTGVEISSKMFEYAKSRQQKKGIQNVQLLHGDATNISDIKDQQFDYATFSMVIHEMPPDLRIKALLEAKRIAKKLIILDFAAPQPANIMGVMSRIIEFLAGIDHFKCFLDFQRNNGISKLLESCQLSIYNESTLKKGAIKIVSAQSPIN